MEILIGIVVAVALLEVIGPWLIGLLCIIGLFYLIAWVAEKSKKAEEEGKRKKQQEVEEREREKTKIANEINMYLHSQNLANDSIENLYQKSDSWIREYIQELVLKEKDNIQRDMLQDIKAGKITKAYEKISMLNVVFPEDEKVQEQYNKIQELYRLISNPHCYIMSNQYGIPDQTILSKIGKSDSRSTIEGSGILFPFWTYTFKKPFDIISYKSLFYNLKSMTPQYGEFLIDILVSVLYIAKNVDSTLANTLLDNYLQKTEQFIIKANNEVLKEFASALHWLGYFDLENLCLQRRNH